MKNKLITISVTAFILLTSMGFASSSGVDSNNRLEVFREKVFEGLTQELQLTKDQQTFIREQSEVNKGKRSKLHKKLLAKREELKDELEKQKMDENKLYRIKSDIKKVIGELIDLRVENIIALKNNLTPEQFTKLQEKSDKKREVRQAVMKKRIESWRKYVESIK